MLPKSEKFTFFIGTIIPIADYCFHMMATKDFALKKIVLCASINNRGDFSEE